MPSCAVMWDYDGTLVDSRHRNLSVNRSIVQRLTDRPWTDFVALQSVAAYDAAVARCVGWQDFYQREFGLNGTTVEQAGRLWSEIQLADATPVPVFDGVAEALDALSDLPHGIVSQNAARIISATLAPSGLGSRFGQVIGYEEVPPGRQKPAPDGLLVCLRSLTDLEPGRAWYVGDHPTDARCARQASDELRTRGLDVEVRSIAVLYGGESPDLWEVQPDATARTPADIVRIIREDPLCGVGAMAPECEERTE